MIQSTISLYTISCTADSFSDTIHQLLLSYTPKGVPLRLTFFSDVRTTDNYYRQLDIINEIVATRFVEKPLVSLVAQPPLGGLSLAVEVEEYAFGATESYCFKEEDGLRYLLMQTSIGKELLICGASGERTETVMQRQAEVAFEKIARILRREEFPVSSIVRQWNYLERITEFDGDRQRYQGFNDARSAFYAEGAWETGYPAATGIGSYAGGVCIDLMALVPNESVSVYPIDNRLQIAAHDYSQAVLLGATMEQGIKSTPKFERAKLVAMGTNRVLYVSGTAAIRGEDTVLMDAGAQTETTLENIAFLTEGERQREYGVEPRELHPSLWRVYIKSATDYQAVKAVMDAIHPTIPTLYVEADVCREELLMEIEGIAGVGC